MFLLHAIRSVGHLFRRMPWCVMASAVGEAIDFFAGYGGWLNRTELNTSLGSAQAKGWTEQHDKLLLLAVRKHGFGRWLDIAQDPEFGLQSKLAEPAVPAGQLPCHQLSSRPHCRSCQALIMTIDPCVTVALRLLLRRS